MRRFALAVMLAAALCARAEEPVIEVNTLSTTHVVFHSDLSYVDISRPEAVVARIVDASKNMLAIKARQSFTYETTVSALEVNGTMRTFVVRYNEKPATLVVDTRPGAVEGNVNTQRRPGGAASSGADAPTLEEVTALEQGIFDVADRSYRIEALCTNLFAYSDAMYVVLELNNRSDIGYEAGEAQFTIETVDRRRRSLTTEKTLWSRSSYGSLSCAPRSKVVVGYTIPKTTLLENEVLCIYIYEKGGTRNLRLTLDDRAVNLAPAP